MDMMAAVVLIVALFAVLGAGMWIGPWACWPWV